MVTLNDRAQACADVLDDLYANRPAADMVRLLAQQRAELLEVLKLADRKIVKMYDGITCGCGEDYAKIDEDSIAIREVITKAEATE